MRARTEATVAAVAGVLAAVLAILPAAPAAADHGGPSAAAVAASKARVSRLEHQVAAAAAAVDRAQRALDALRTKAEIAAEQFNRAQLAQAAAQRALTGAQVAVAAADRLVRHSRGQVTRFAVAAYESGGPVASVDAVLTSGGPQTLLSRLQALDAVARTQRDVVQALTAATVYDGVVRAQAAEMVQQAGLAAAAADRARRDVQHAIAVQTAGVATVTAAQHRLSTMLTQARAHATGLERARLAAIARARAEAAAARRAAAERSARQQAQQPVAVPAGGYGGTVTAGTEAAAVREAESQIGKPYEWGAAGPDSYDCSGLVMWSYAQVGVHVDHWTGDQWNEGAHIPLAALRPGDLLFFATDTNDPNTIHHVGIYIGNAQMVEAPYTGANVRISPAFRPDLIGAVRLYNR